MPRRTALPSVLTALIVASLACTLPGIGRGGPGTEETIPPMDVSTGATSTPSDQPLEPPPPAGLTEAIEERVASGEWSYEDGLLNGLRLFTGELALDGLFPERPVFLEGFGLVRDVQRYIRDGADAAVQDQLEQLLDRLTPSTERLLEWAEPAPTGSFGGPGLAAPAVVGDECATLFDEYSQKGFPPGSGIKCLLYKEGGIGGQTVRVFWPIVYLTDTDYADQAYNAVLQSWQTYAKLTPSGAPAQMKGVDLLFMLLPHVEDPEVMAWTPSPSTDDRCLIMVYMGAIQKNEQTKSGPGDYGPFLQTIAHEMFHCFQVSNFSTQADDPWGMQDWWAEGTAEYFSNVVYPNVNAEWRWIDDLAYHSAVSSLMEMTYENSAFFQFFANERGHQAILDMIKGLPSGGGLQEQANAVATKVSDAQTLFHDFGRAYLDGRIQDASGSFIPTIPPYIPADHKIELTEAQIRSLEAKPFVLSRYAITFPQGWRYANTRTVTGSAEGYDAARVDHAAAAWGDFPATVDAGCAPVRYFVLLTSAASTGTFSVEYSMTPDKQLGCDECLIGTWDINIESFTEYAEAPFQETPGLYEFDSAGGLWRYHFRPDGTMLGEFDFFYTYLLHQDNAPFGADVEIDGAIRIEGTGEGTYASDGASNLSFQLVKDAVTIVQEIYMNGKKMDEGPIDSSAGYGYSTGASVVYSCDDEAGELLMNVAPTTGLPPIQFDRVSKQP